MFFRLIPGMMLALTLTADVASVRTENTAVRKEFDNRVGEYLKLRKRATAGVAALKTKAMPDEIQAHKLTLARAIRAARSDARQGTIFTPEIQEHFREIVRSEMRGRHGAPAKAAANQGNPAAEGSTGAVPVKVNADYPDSAPLSTTPATLLLRLPTLPKELDFRFVGRSLILRDVDASLIVDYIPNAIP